MGTVVERTPYDVWVNISRFLPHNVVGTLYGVNRSFLQIATSARYRALTFKKCDKHTKWLLKILSDPTGRGSFVREITIEPWLVQPSLKPSHKRGASLWSFICGLFDPHFAERKMNQKVQKRLNKDILRFTRAISLMPNLSKYSLEWNHERHYHPELYGAFLSPVLKRIQGNLLSLSLNVPPEMLCTLPSVALPHLKHLGFDLCTKKKSAEEISQYFDSFVVFVNNLYPTLESLSVSTRVPSRALKLDRFFEMLGSFPHLRSFSICIPFDGAHLKSHTEVVKFLDKHRMTLRHLHFTTRRCSAPDFPLSPEAKFWIRNILTSLRTPYPNLHDVYLEVRPIRSDLTPLMNFLEQHAIDSLTLTERALTYNEVKGLLDALGAYNDFHRLKRLCLKLEHLSVPLLELFAARIPRLGHLELTFGDVSTEVHPGYPHPHSRHDEFQLFEATIRRNPIPYTSWQLVTLGLGSSDACVPDLFRLFADCIPSVREHVDLRPCMSRTRF